ncbi:MAG: hypothetical protein IPH64_03855, partial [Comamonadaceae bacterium]|nr:hypothetical protein [Comamonadaceae bacterium]
HNWWHLALFELELDHAATVLDLYDRQVQGVVRPSRRTDRRGVAAGAPGDRRRGRG